jgi:alpha-ribazole phosphatase
VSGRLVHLLRHGETALSGRFLGRTDPPPTPAAIAACRERACGLSFETIVCSDLLRTRLCAEAIGPAVIDARWRELDFGDWDGLLASEIDAEALARFWADPDANPPPGGERWSSLVARTGAALADLPGGDVLVVTHGGAMRAVLAHFFGFDQRQLWAFDLPLAGLLTLRLWPDAAQIVRLTP